MGSKEWILIRLLVEMAVIVGIVYAGFILLKKKNPKLADKAGYLWDQGGMFIILILLFFVCCLNIEHYWELGNLIKLMLSVSTVGIIACTMLFCLSSGDFDISIGSVAAFAAVVSAVVMTRYNSFVIGLGAGLLAGGLAGLLNGLIIAKLKINALITTLSSMMIFRGLSLIVGEGKLVSVTNEPFISMGSWYLPLNFTLPFIGEVSERIYSPIFFMFAFFAVFGFILHKTTFGRNALAIGGNEEAARLAGISVDRIKIIIFTVQGMVAGFAGMLLAANLEAAESKPQDLLELKVIAACVLGGVSLTGGVGSILFIISGVLIMGMIEQAMTLIDIDSFWQYVVRGTVLLVAVIIDKFKNK